MLVCNLIKGEIKGSRVHATNINSHIDLSIDIVINILSYNNLEEHYIGVNNYVS